MDHFLYPSLSYSVEVSNIRFRGSSPITIREEGKQITKGVRFV